MTARVNWRGREVLALADRAAADAIDATMSAAILDAKANHGAGAHSVQRFITRTAELERSVRIVAPARRDARSMVGRWGSQGLAYARRIEVGFQGQDRAGRMVDADAYPYLRPAAEREYPKLADRIRRAFRRLESR